jgi:hypothetical protein
VVAPLARAHPASAGGVGEGTLACGPTPTCTLCFRMRVVMVTGLYF